MLLLLRHPSTFEMTVAICIGGGFLLAPQLIQLTIFTVNEPAMQQATAQTIYIAKLVSMPLFMRGTGISSTFCVYTSQHKTAKDCSVHTRTGKLQMLCCKHTCHTVSTQI